MEVTIHFQGNTVADTKVSEPWPGKNFSATEK